MSPSLLTPEAVAQHLGIKVKTVHRLVREGKLGCVQVTDRGRKFTEGHLQEFIESRTIHIPKPVDRKSRNKIPSPRKGGESRSCGDSAKALREEMRSWL